MPFLSGFKTGTEPAPRALWFGFDSGKVLVKQAEGIVENLREEREVVSRMRVASGTADESWRLNSVARRC